LAVDAVHGQAKFPLPPDASPDVLAQMVGDGLPRIEEVAIRHVSPYSLSKI
jgi:hypothetical protein